MQHEQQQQQNMTFAKAREVFRAWLKDVAGHRKYAVFAGRFATREKAEEFLKYVGADADELLPDGFRLAIYKLNTDGLYRIRIQPAPQKDTVQRRKTFVIE